MPKVSVLTPIYNTKPEYLRECIESILNQTFTDFEFLILNDSPQNTEIEKIVKSYKDSRIRYYKNETNIGISASRNKLLELACGEYIAVSDHDDISLPTRLEKQVAFLDHNPEVGAISSSIEIFPNTRIWHLPCENMSIRMHMMRDNFFPHTACMIRKNVLDENAIRYEQAFSPCEDYRLVLRLMNHTILHNLPDILVKYRLDETCTTNKQKEKMDFTRDLCKNFAMREFPFTYNQAVEKNIIPNSNTLNAANKSYYIKLFGFIPIIKVKVKPHKICCYLFNFILAISIYKVKKAGIVQKLKQWNYKRKIKHHNAVSYRIMKHFKGKPGKNILLLSHDLSMTGAPMALLNMAISLRKQGMNPVMISHTSGQFKKEIRKSKIPLLIFPDLDGKITRYEWPKFLSNFNTIVFNTIETIRRCKNFDMPNIKKVLWAHEAVLAYAVPDKVADINREINNFFDKIYTVGDYAHHALVNNCNVTKKVESLLYGMNDFNKPLSSYHQDDKTYKIALIGSISHRKGHDILIKALEHIPDDIKSRLKIYMAGPISDQNIFNQIKSSKYCKYMNQLSHDKLMNLVNECDLLICPSIDDPMPIVCTEAFILQKPIIVSDISATGTAQFVTHKKNGYLVPPNDPECLAKAITDVFMDRKNWKTIGKNARKIYEENFAMSHFDKNVKNMIIDC